MDIPQNQMCSLMVLHIQNNQNTIIFPGYSLISSIRRMQILVLNNAAMKYSKAKQIVQGQYS